MSPLDSLMKRLEAANRPDAELDADIVQALFPDDAEYAFESGALPNGARYNFTESLDAAASLMKAVLPKHNWSIHYEPSSPGLLDCHAFVTSYERAALGHKGKAVRKVYQAIGHDASSGPAITLVLACLRALKAREFAA